MASQRAAGILPGMCLARCVGQTFLSAGSGDFPVARSNSREMKVPWTNRLESLPYVG